ncbi:hypothetical protein HaLaN_15571 [Haematococcus lacustris]|uniref:Uncharacterized protein n=1 Tax=Haematococcus lacustris TaxID=44745 RepID=A0A699ZBD7_HAELA|nr:hypothetical protein HaLaN_15571 [Haematococcus lacustris]
MSILRGLNTFCKGHQVKPPGHQVTAFVQGHCNCAPAAVADLVRPASRAAAPASPATLAADLPGQPPQQLTS